MDSKVPVNFNKENSQPVNESNAISRKFLGKTEDFKDNRERHFYQRMLRAYLKGKKYFQFGKSMKRNYFGAMEMLPDWFTVEQELIYPKN